MPTACLFIKAVTQTNPELQGSHTSLAVFQLQKEFHFLLSFCSTKTIILCGLKLASPLFFAPVMAF